MPSIICRSPEGRSPRPPPWYRESELSLRRALVLLLPTAYTCSPGSRSRLANRAKSLFEDMSTKFVESISVHQVHHVDHQAHIRCVLPVRAHELLMRDEREADELLFMRSLDAPEPPGVASARIRYAAAVAPATPNGLRSPPPSSLSPEFLRPGPDVLPRRRFIRIEHPQDP